MLGGQPQRLVHRVGVQRLGAAEHRGQGLQRRAHDVDLGLLRGQGRAGGLGVEAQAAQRRVVDAEALAHDTGPQPARGAELGDLFEEVGVAVEEERKRGRRTPRSARPRVERGLAVGDRVGQREGDLLHRGRAGLAHVVARDRDRVPARQVLVAVGEDVAGDAQRRPGRVDVGAARDVLLEQVVLHRPREPRSVDALLAGHRDVQGEQDRGGRVDRHRGRDPVERDAVEQLLHVLERRDRDADLADLARWPSRGRSRSPSASAGRRPRTDRSDPARAGSGSAGWSPRRCRSRSTGAWSRSGRGTSSAERRA